MRPPLLSWINWKHAVGEVVLLIVGILSALAVNAWWDGRTDVATERAYLQQLRADVDANEAAIEEGRTAHATAADRATRLASAFDATGPLPSCDQLEDMLETTLNWSSLDLRTGTHTALLTTGDIRLVRDDGLRGEVIRYAGVVDSMTAALNQNEQAAWGSAYAFRRRVTYFWRLFEPRPESAPPPWAGCNFEPLRHDPDIREALFSLHLLHNNRIEMYKELADASHALKMRLGESR